MHTSHPLQCSFMRYFQAAIGLLFAAMMQLYPEQKPDVLQQRTNEVAAAFQIERFATKKELNKLAQITGEAAKLFPPDFASVDPQEVVAQVCLLFSYTFFFPALLLIKSLASPSPLSFQTGKDSLRKKINNSY